MDSRNRNKKRIHIICAILLTALGTAVLFLLCRPAEPVKVICMGDSITYGSGVKDSRDTDSYPAQLASLLGEAYQVENYGVGGKTLLDTGDKPYRGTGYIEKTIQEKPDIVVLMLGTNDSRPDNWNREEYEKQYRALIKELKNSAGNPEICIMIPPKAFPNEEGRVIYQINDDIIREQIAGIIEQVAEDTGVSCINLYELTQEHPEYFSDGVHPNKEGNLVIAKVVCNWINQHDGF